MTCRCFFLMTCRCQSYCKLPYTQESRSNGDRRIAGTTTTIIASSSSSLSSHKGLNGAHQMSSEQKEVLKRLKRAMGLCGVFLVIEVIGGYFSGSLAVLSDAAHLFADLASFAVAIAAAYLASMPATDRHTFGLKRAESLAALLSMLSLALVSLYLAVEAIRRMVKYCNGTAAPVDGKLMSGVAFIGVLVNIALAFVLGVENHIHLPGAHDHDHSHDHCGHDDDGGEHHSHSHGHSHDHAESSFHKEEGAKIQENHDHGHDHSIADHAGESKPLLETTTTNSKVYQSAVTQESGDKKPLKNINLQAAYLHVFGDLMQSLGVLVAGLAIWYNPEWTWVDPICTLVFCAFVFYSTLGVLRHSVAVLLQEVPPDMSWQLIYESIAQVEGVTNVHDLHVWSISHGDPALAVHCSCDDNTNPRDAMKKIATVLKTEIGIDHVTIQIQQGLDDCITCCENGGCDFSRISAGSPPPVWNESNNEKPGETGSGMV
mmetsp:Transcript_28325/g.77761  ORF Transcript_28325/g.77761 Transcript_28325/m.77761 type:complete len:487 (+) Transcript_28325:39-1499(+)